MKVPKMYKSSDRYNAGVDVIYDDDSKLQYAPFIYATTQSGDNGADEGGDEEGEDSMVIKYDTENSRYDKTWKEVYDASVEGKTVIVVENVTNYEELQVFYLISLVIDETATDNPYTAIFGALRGSPANVTSVMLKLVSATADDYLVSVSVG